MKSINENDVLAAVKRAEPKKKRVNFFITVQAKEALASWCSDNGEISESSAIEQMIRAVVPTRYFKEEK
jgi:hypothetical protein